MLGGVDRVHVDGPRLDGEDAAVGHRVAGVDDQVEHDLLELPGIGPDAGEIRRQLQHQHDVLADQALDHVLQAGDDGAQVDNLAASGSAGG